MRPSLVVTLLLCACAGPRAASVAAPEPVAATPSADQAPSPYAARLAKRFRGEGVSLKGWPVQRDLPKPEKCYVIAFLWEDGACDGWWYDLLVDLKTPRVVWVRRTGTIVGIREYLGPAEIVDDSGPLALRIGE